MRILGTMGRITPHRPCPTHHLLCFFRLLPVLSMKTSRSLVSYPILLAALSVMAAGSFAPGCAATATRDSTGQYVDDSVITTRVKSALLGDERVKSFAVTVETMKRVVQLSGFVNTEEQKAAAGHDAEAVANVKSVQNNLIVK